MPKQTYSSVKGSFVQQRMNEGKTNEQARKEWKKSPEKKQFSEQDNVVSKGIIPGDTIDRDYNSPMQDWAETADDL